GMVEVPSCTVLPDGFEGELRLKQTSASGTDEVEAYLKLLITSKAHHDGRPPVRPEVPQRLYVTVLHAKNLRNADHAPGAGVSDPYVTCSLTEDDVVKASFNTETKKDTLSPVWNHTDSFAGFKDGMCLLFEVWDQDPFLRKDALGSARISFSQLAAAFKKESMFLKDLLLEDSGSRQAGLSVRVATAAVELTRLRKLATEEGLDQALEHHHAMKKILEETGRFLSRPGLEVLQDLAAEEKRRRNFRRALEHLEEAKKMRTLFRAMETVPGAKLLLELGGVHFALRDFEKAEESYEACHQRLRALQLLNTSQGATLLGSRGALQLAMARPERALASFQEAAEIRSDCGSLDTVEGAALLTNQGSAHFTIGNLPAAVGDYRKALLILKGIAWPSEDCAELLRNLGLALRKQGNALDAAAVFQEAVHLRREKLGGLRTPAGTRLLSNLGVALAQAARWQPAEKAFQEAKSYHQNLHTLESAEGAALLLNLGSAKQMLNHLDAAMKELEEARRIRTATNTAGKIEAAELFRTMGSVSLAKGDAQAALRHFEEARKVRLALNLMQTSGGAELWRDIGLAHAAAKDLQQASNAFDNAGNLSKETLGEALLKINQGSLLRRGVVRADAVSTPPAQLLRWQRKEDGALAALQKAQDIYKKLNLLDTVEGMLLQDNVRELEKSMRVKADEEEALAKTETEEISEQEASDPELPGTDKSLEEGNQVKAPGE
ncbi:unnamed protein product, partial [Effrenium voratum]